MVDGVDNEYLVRELARRRVVPVIGAGISKHALAADGVTKPPLWWDLLTDCIEQHSGCPQAATEALNSNDLLHASEWIRDHIGGEAWRAYLRSRFVAPNFRYSDIHTRISELDQRIYFSLNFDAIFERAATAEYGDTLTVKHYYDDDIAQVLTGDLRYLVYVHGSKNSFDRVILSHEDYARVRNHNAHFYRVVDAIIQTHSFLFLGCGTSDPDFNLLLENHSFASPSDEARMHFRFSHETKPELERSLLKNRRIQTLHYDPADENHTGLLEAIKDLAASVDEKREELRETANW